MQLGNSATRQLGNSATRQLGNGQRSTVNGLNQPFSLMEENLRHLVVEDFTGNHPGIIFGTTLQSNGGLISPRPNNGWTQVGIDIGTGGILNLGSNSNVITTAGIGIRVHGASVNQIDNNFIACNAILNPPGVCIHAYADFANTGINNAYINIGTTSSNTFLSNLIGIGINEYQITNVSNNGFFSAGLFGIGILNSNLPQSPPLSSHTTTVNNNTGFLADGMQYICITTILLWR